MKISFSVESDTPDDLAIIADIATYAAARHHGHKLATSSAVSSAPAVAFSTVAPTDAPADTAVPFTPQDAKEAVAALAAEAVAATKRKRRSKEEIAREEAAEMAKNQPSLPLSTEVAGAPEPTPAPTPMPTQKPAISESLILNLLGDGDGSFTDIVPDEPAFETYAAWDRTALWEHLRLNWNKALSAQAGAEFLRDTISKYSAPAMSALNEEQMRSALLEMDRRARSSKMN
jgi:hypothetical protein